MPNVIHSARMRSKTVERGPPFSCQEVLQLPRVDLQLPSIVLCAEVSIVEVSNHVVRDDPWPDLPNDGC